MRKLLSLLPSFGFLSIIHSAPNPSSTFKDAVYSLPGYDGHLRSQHYAGYMSVSKDASDTTNQLFYWFITAEENYDASTPTLIWLNGGPGASSLTGLLVENMGPQIVTGDGKIIENENRLSKKYNLMAVDNPVGAGFSYTTNGRYPKNEEEVRQQFVQGLRNFFDLHPELLVHPLWMAGESYATKYIPNIVHELHTQIAIDKVAKGPLATLGLKGMILGNGLYIASLQYTTVTDFAFAHGVIDEKNHALGKQNESKCLARMKANSDGLAGQFCENGTVRWIYNDVAKLPMYYDLGLVHMDLDSISASMGAWLNREDVKAAFHVTGHEWVNADETGPVADALNSDFTLDVAPLVAEAAENGYRVALYNGVRDGSVCNHIANTIALLEMDKTWKFKGQFAAAESTPMWFQGSLDKEKRVAGYHQIVEKFSFTKLLHTGHLVPIVVPKEYGAFIDWVTDYSSTGHAEVIV